MLWSFEDNVLIGDFAVVNIAGWSLPVAPSPCLFQGVLILAIGNHGRHHTFAEAQNGQVLISWLTRDSEAKAKGSRQKESPCEQKVSFPNDWQIPDKGNFLLLEEVF